MTAINIFFMIDNEKQNTNKQETFVKVKWQIKNVYHKINLNYNENLIKYFIDNELINKLSIDEIKDNKITNLLIIKNNYINIIINSKEHIINLEKEFDLKFINEKKNLHLIFLKIKILILNMINNNNFSLLKIKIYIFIVL